MMLTSDNCKGDFAKANELGIKYMVKPIKRISLYRGIIRSIGLKKVTTNRLKKNNTNN